MPQEGPSVHLRDPHQINKAFIGKTIDSVSVVGCNQWVFHFTDGTKTTILTTTFAFGVSGIAVSL